MTTLISVLLWVTVRTKQNQVLMAVVRSLLRLSLTDVGTVRHLRKFLCFVSKD
jgi:hypothetical protein